MAGKKVEFHEEASQEYEASVGWYLARSTLVASRFAAEIERAIRAIVESPQLWPATNQGIRKFILQHFPYVVVYRDLPLCIQVLAVAHGHRRPGYWKNRMEPRR